MILPKNLINSLILTLILIICATVTALPSFTNHEVICPGCWCISSIGSSEMQCPGPPEQLKIHVTVQTGKPDKSVTIECESLQGNGYRLLPNMTIGDIQTVTIRKCPLPLGTPLNNIIKRLGITNVRVLFFDRGHDEKMQTIHLKGLNDLQRLRLSGIDFSDMPDDIFSEVKNLNWLDLRSNKINLPNNIFAPLSNLEYLELGHNKLQDILPGTFRNQKRLVHLNLWSNNLTNLTSSAFEDATSITDLDLSSNNIETLRSDVFKYLQNLTNINLNGNYFKKLPKGLFDNNKKLQQFRLNNNRVPLNELPEKLFSNLTELKVITITSYLKILPSNLFTGSINIQNISFFDNQIEFIPDGLLSDQINLLKLDMSFNKISKLSDDLLANTSNLEYLLLSSNQLVNITSNFFKNLSRLKYLELQNNRLITLPSKTFKTYTPELEMINLQNNQLNFKPEDLPLNFSIESPFNGLEKLRILNLRNNSIIRIYQDWMLELLKLENLDLSYNQITQFTYNDLQFLSRDITINLSNNQISLINFIYIELLDLKGQKMKFTLDNNPIACTCDILQFVEFLRGNLANHLRSVFDINTENLYCNEPSNLKDFKITDLNTKSLLCPIDRLCPNCECMARPVDKHLIMNCSNRQLKEIPILPQFNESRLEFIELHIENNLIKQLPNINYGGMINVTEIYAHNNQIDKLISENLPYKLKILDLSNNTLKKLNDSVMKTINDRKNLINISLGNNPWLCDCPLTSLSTFVQTNSKHIYDVNKMRCSNNGQLIASLDVSDICSQDHLLIATSIIIALFGLCLGIMAALYYKYQLEIKVWLYAHNMCLWFVTEEELDKDKKYDAFISYSHKDEEFITEYLVPELENGLNPFKLCLHYRDWIGGEFIPDQIAKSVEESRRTIVILSLNFLESIWGRMEFRAAHQAAISEGRARLIVIIYGDIGDIDELDTELKAYLKMNTYVKWGDPWFWNKLRYALPHPNHLIHNNNNRTNGLIKSSIKSSIDDRLELIKPIPVTPPLTSTPPAEQAGKNPLVTKLNGDIKSINNGINYQTQQQYNNNGNYQHNNQQQNGKLNGINGHINGAFIINTNAKQSDV